MGKQCEKNAPSYFGFEDAHVKGTKLIEVEGW